MNWITLLYHQWRRAARLRRIENLKWQAFALYMETHDVLLKTEFNAAWRHLGKARDMAEFVK